VKENKPSEYAGVLHASAVDQHKSKESRRNPDKNEKEMRQSSLRAPLLERLFFLGSVVALIHSRFSLSVLLYTSAISVLHSAAFTTTLSTMHPSLFYP
jgi:hypothetical protein